MTLSMHLCSGLKQPSSWEFAALTMAVISVKDVISPFQDESRREGIFGSLVCCNVALGAIEVVDVCSLWALWYSSVASMWARESDGILGIAGL